MGHYTDGRHWNDKTKAWEFDEPQEVGLSDLNDLLSAAKTGAEWMRWWLEQDECECEYGHTCGKLERMHELEKMEAAIVNAEGR